MTEHNQPTTTSGWKLCYVRDNWAWFTTHDLQELSGDDWDDQPYQLNGSVPYSPTVAHDDDAAYLKVAFDGPLKTPDDVHGSRNNLTTNDIVHRQTVPWLQTDRYSSAEPINIFAGTLTEEFATLINRVGGTVYYPE